MAIPSDILETLSFRVEVGEDGDLWVTAQIVINTVSWTVVVMDPESRDDPEDYTSGTAEFFKRLLIEGQFQIVFLDSIKTIELY